MPNPMMSLLRKSSGNNMLQQIAQIKNMLSGQDPNAVLNSMMSKNTQFAKFVNDNKNKPIEQIASENGIDLSMLKQLLG